jgi:hypothetical protein
MKTRAEMYLVFKLRVTLETQLQQWFSGQQNTLLQVCKGELMVP